MSRQRVPITDFSKGMLSRKVMGRVDLPLQQKAAEEIEGFVLSPDGGITRRRGTVLIKNGLGITPATDGLYADESIPAFVVIRVGEVGSEVPWMVYVNDDPRQIVAVNLRTGAQQTTSLATLEAGEPIQKTQTFYSEADEDVSNQTIHLSTPGHSFALNVYDWSITELADKNVATVYQNRLIAVDRSWGTIHMSIPLEMLDFTLTEQVAIPETDPVEYETVETGAIENIPDFYGAERVLWLTSRQSVYMGTDSAEYEILSAYPYFSTEAGGVQVVKISEIGTEGTCYLGPYMIVRKGQRLIRIQWQGENQYLTDNVTEYIDNKKVIKHLSVEYGSHRYLLFVDIEQNLYCLTEAPFSKISGWTKLASGVWWIDTWEGDLYIARSTGGAFKVEVLPLDSLYVPGDRSAHLNEAFYATQFHADGCGYLTVGASAVTGDLLPASSTMEVYKMVSGELTYVGQYDTDANGELDGTLSAIQTFVGYTDTDIYLFCHGSSTFTSKVKTLPLHIGSGLGSSLGQLKHVHGIVVVVHQSTALKARVNDGPWESWSSSEEFTGAVPLRLEGLSADTVQVEIQAIDEEPLTIMSIEADVEVGEL